ncbi:MAG: hypothetical protein EXR07_13835 [Acetobacteraceae bacterium]|nr:hypothetical protein [Acetobacteraceae bacterium]
MEQPLCLTLQVFDHEPAHSAGVQVWKGGATDLETRTMIADPPRWLLIADHTLDQAPERAPLRQWRLEQINPGTLVSPENAGGVVLVSMTPDPEREEEFNDWYNMEHIPHFNRLPGVIAARRFRAIEGNPRYVALYHVENTDIYATPGWMAANETPWILRMRRFQRDRTYFMFGQRIV